MKIKILKGPALATPPRSDICIAMCRFIALHGTDLLLNCSEIVQSPFELMRINFKFEAPILQVQIITCLHYIFYNILMEMLTCFTVYHSRQDTVTT